MAGNQQSRKDTSKRLAWTPTKEAMLIDLWQENIDDLRGIRKNSHIYQEMAEKMQVLDSGIQWTDVRTKVDNLTRKYREEKQKVGPSGGSISTWQYFAKINEFLGTFAISNAQERAMQSTSTNVIVLDPNNMETQEEIEPPSKRRKNNQEAVLELMRERNNMQREQNEYYRQTLDEYKKRNIEFQERVLQFIEKKMDKE